MEPFKYDGVPCLYINSHYVYIKTASAQIKAALCAL